MKLSDLFSKMPTGSNTKPEVLAASKEDQYWQLQESLNSDKLRSNPQYIEWKRKQKEGDDSDVGVEPIPMV